MNWGYIRTGLALLCCAALAVVVGLVLKPDHKPGLGESYLRQNMADTISGIGILLVIAGLVLLVIGLLKAPARQPPGPDPD